MIVKYEDKLYLYCKYCKIYLYDINLSEARDYEQRGMEQIDHNTGLWKCIFACKNDG